MKIYPITDKEGNLHAFEIENFKVSRKRAASIVKAIPGVAVPREPKKILSWFREEVFCEFILNGVVFQIDEPYGDNSRYWVGKKEEGGWCPEIEVIKNAFLASSQLYGTKNLTKSVIGAKKPDWHYVAPYDSLKSRPQKDEAMWENIEKEQESTEKFTGVEIANFEHKYGVRLSADHKIFLSEFGQGVLYNHIRIFGLGKVEQENAEFQNRWTEYYLWESSNSALSKAALAESVIIGDTFNGDEFVISPEKNGVFLLPQDEDCIVCLGNDLETSINKFINLLMTEIAGYDKEEQEEWDIRPVFNVDTF